MSTTHVLGALTLAATITSSQAVNLSVTFTNENPTGNFYFTPIFSGFHDGGFDLFDQGAAASGALEALAEEGAVGGLQTQLTAAGSGFQSDVITGPSGFGSTAPQPPVLDPGETGTLLIDVDPANRYFSFASMLIPSNDAFIGNGSPIQNEIFDAMGNFNGPFTLQVLYSQVWDAGTENNDGQGAAFSATGGTATDTVGGTVELLPPGNLFPTFNGTSTAAGTLVDTNFGGADVLIGTITITQVPEPSSAFLLGLGALAGLARRRR